MKIIYAGTAKFAAVALQALYQAGHDIVLVLTQPDRPAGRGLALHASPVKQCALAHGTPVIQPLSLRLDGPCPAAAQQAHTVLHTTAHDVLVTAAYGLILPRSVLDIAPYGGINIHASLLPRWRGAAPIQRAIEAGDTQTGITIMQMDEGLDTGPILSMHPLPIAADDTAGSLHDKLANLAGTMIVTALQQLEQGALTATPQPEHGVSYAPKLSKTEAMLDFTLSAETLARKVRAFNPAPGACARFGQTILKIGQACALPIDMPRNARPGQILTADARHNIQVACGQGILQIVELQKPGGKRLPAREFIKGFVMECGFFD